MTPLAGYVSWMYLDGVLAAQVGKLGFMEEMCSPGPGCLQSPPVGELREAGWGLCPQSGVARA